MEEYGYVSGNTPSFWSRLAPYIKSKTFTFVILAALAVATPLTAFYLQNNTFDTRQRASGGPGCADSDGTMHGASGGSCSGYILQCYDGSGTLVSSDPRCNACDQQNAYYYANCTSGQQPAPDCPSERTRQECSADGQIGHYWCYGPNGDVDYSCANRGCYQNQTGGSQITYCPLDAGGGGSNLCTVGTQQGHCADSDGNLRGGGGRCINYLGNGNCGSQWYCWSACPGDAPTPTPNCPTTRTPQRCIADNQVGQYWCYGPNGEVPDGCSLFGCFENETGGSRITYCPISSSPNPTVTPRPPTPTTPIGGGTGCTDYECSENVSGGIAGKYYSCRGMGTSASCFEGRNCSSGRSVTSPNTYCTATTTQPTATPTPTGTTGGPNPSPTPTGTEHGTVVSPTGSGPSPTGGNGGVTLALELILQGIGLPTNLIDGEAQPNVNPASNVRTKPVTVEIMTAQSTTVPIIKTDSLIYDPTSKKFKANIDIGAITSNFSVQIRMPGYATQLVGQRSGAVIQQPAASITIRETILAADINSDGFITGDDYEKAGSSSSLKACFNKTPITSHCQYADINADGKIDLIDYKFLIDNIIKRK